MATHLQGRYTGCLLGLALGDACGAPLEGGWPERLLWRCIGTTKQGEMRWTDDTQMALDIGEVLLAQGHDDGALPVYDIAQRFARSYRWSRGYGPGAAKVLRRIRRGVPWQQASRSVYPAGSWGNGGAMRSPVVALWWPGNAEQLVQSTTAITQITHGHALAIEGAVLIAVATAAALRGEGAPAILLVRDRVVCGIAVCRARLAGHAGLCGACGWRCRHHRLHGWGDLGRDPRRSALACRCPAAARAACAYRGGG